MNPRLKQMVNELKTAGENCGYLCANDQVWIRGPGEPYSDTPTMYTAKNLAAAIESGLLLEQKMLGNRSGVGKSNSSLFPILIVFNDFPFDKVIFTILQFC